jgi:hypothetical protein
MGKAKPMAIPGGGGVIMFNDHELGDRLSRALLHNYEDLRWTRLASRHLDMAHQAGMLQLQAEALVAGHAEYLAQADHVRGLLFAATSLLEPLPVPDQVVPGISVVLPFLLPERYPLTAREVHRVASAEGVPLVTLPVTPPYREPAGAQLAGACPCAERLADRLVFLPSSSVEVRAKLSSFDRLLTEAAERCGNFTYPYTVRSTASAELPDVLCGPVILGRKLDGGFVALNQASGRRFSVSPAVAARILQESGAVE